MKKELIAKEDISVCVDFDVVSYVLVPFLFCLTLIFNRETSLWKARRRGGEEGSTIIIHASPCVRLPCAQRSAGLCVVWLTAYCLEDRRQDGKAEGQTPPCWLSLLALSC